MTANTPNINPEPALPLGETVSATPATRPDKAVLKGRYVTLTPLDPASHGEALWEGTRGKDNERLWLYLSEGPFTDRSAFDAYLQRKAASEDPLFFAIINAAGEAVGVVTFMRIDTAHRTIEIGNVLYSAALQRTPGGSEVIYLLAKHAFSDLGYRRLEWKCNALHAGSRRAALRYGFTFEGVFRQHMIVKGRNRDTAWFSMLDTEWDSRQLAFEAWLDPKNFDQGGSQRETLAEIRARSERRTASG
jgi:RimJ/RimL family protein N-acetyltransferase